MEGEYGACILVFGFFLTFFYYHIVVLGVHCDPCKFLQYIIAEFTPSGGCILCSRMKIE
jgi:hypothetical protein